MKNYPQFPTIRQEAASGGTVTEYQLRLMLAQGQLPGFYVGKTFRINHAQLVERLNEMSTSKAKEVR